MTIDHQTIESNCLNCGKGLDAAMNAAQKDDPPSLGDVTICFYCHHLMIYGDGMKLRNPTDDEMKEIAADKDILFAMRMLGETKKYDR